jgi:hypothetical protein
MYALPSTGTLKYSTIYGPDTSEYTIMRAIVAVCRRWWDVGIELLYKEVIIRWADSLALLLRTLVAPGSHVGRLIKKMVISCFVPFGNDLTVFEESMKHVIANCSSLSNLILDPSFGLSQNAPYNSISRSLRIEDGVLNIRHLDWGHNLLLYDLVSVLQYCPNLESLRFHLHDDHHHDFQNAISTSVLLPRLQELQLVRDSPNPLIEHAESRLTARWSMPQLQRFTYDNNDFPRFVNRLGLVDIVGFCRIHGGSLRYLHLGPDLREWVGKDALQGILDQCPTLEHIVLWMSGNLHTVCSLVHPKIMWIDVWVEMVSTLKILKNFLQIRPQGLLSLDRVRVFDNRLWRPHATDLPFLLHPATAVLEDGFEYNYIGLNITQKGNLVCRTDLTWNFLDGEADTSDDGSDFHEEASDDTSNGDTSDDDDNSSFGEESSTSESDVEQNPEFALASFLSILES